MEILYVANARIPTEKAHGLQIVKTVEALIELGHKVRLVVPTRLNPIKNDPFSFYSLRVNFPIVYLPNPLTFLESFSKNYYFKLQRVIFGFSAFFYCLDSSEKYVYTRDIALAFFLSVLTRKIVAFEDHEPKRSFYLLNKIFLKKIPKKVIVAKNLVKLYENYGIDPKSFVIAPNGVDLREFKFLPDKSIWQKNLGLSLDLPVVLYVGHFYRWKGVYVLIEAGASLNGIANVVLIGGTKKDNQELKSYIEEHNLTNVFLGDFLPHREVIKFMKAADVLILPNTAEEERSAQYTTPIKLFEYMASGVPVVASNLASFDGYLTDGHNAILCRPDDVFDLVEKVKYVISNKSLAQSLSRNALSSASSYTWNSRAEKIFNLLSRKA